MRGALGRGQILPRKPVEREAPNVMRKAPAADLGYKNRFFAADLEE